MKIEIDSKKMAATLVAATILAAFAWMWKINERVAKIESPSSMLSRVETLEKLTFPIAVEFEVRKRMGEANPVVQPEQPSGAEPGSPLPPPPPDEVADDDALPEELRYKAEDDIRSMIEQRPIKDARKRRGRPVQLKKKD